MDPLQLFSSGRCALATTDAQGAPLVALVDVCAAPERLVFDTRALPLGREATVRAEDRVTEPLDGAAFVRWAEARGVLDERGLRVLALSSGEFEGASVELVERLWRRGLPGDARAVELLAQSGAVPTFLRAPAGARLLAALTHEQREDAANLLASTYWNEGITRERIAAAVHAATVNVGAVDASGKLIAHARALADRTKYAWIYDVVVEPSWRGNGLGQRLMKILLDHPLVRDAHQVLLATRDAQSLYAKFGFVDRKVAPSLRSWTSTEMVLRRVR